MTVHTIFMRTSLLKAVLDRKLHDARITGLGGDLAEGPRVETDVRIAPVEVVEQIERLDAEFHRPARAERENAGDRDVDFPEARAFDGSRGLVAERAGRGNGERCRAQIVRQRLRRVRIRRGLVDPLRGNAAERPVL